MRCFLMTQRIFTTVGVVTILSDNAYMVVSVRLCGKFCLPCDNWK